MSKAKSADSIDRAGLPDTSGPSGRLDAGVQALSVPEPMAEAEGILLKAGVLMPIIGLVLMVVAWWTSSGTAIVAEQIPMLISGGIVGLGLLLIGLGLFVRYSLTRMFRFWLARLMVEQQAQTDRVVAALDSIETVIRESRVK